MFYDQGCVGRVELGPIPEGLAERLAAIPGGGSGQGEFRKRRSDRRRHGVVLGNEGIRGCHRIGLGRREVETESDVASCDGREHH